MPSLTKRTLAILAVSLLLPAMVSLWRVAVADSIGPSTYAVGSALLLASAAIALMSLPPIGTSAVAAGQSASE